jgi:hypothetical protein
MDLDHPTYVDAARQIIVGVVAVTATLALALLFGFSYYLAIGRLDWAQLVR